LEALRIEVPGPNQVSYRAWSERIRFIATEHRDMGHEWRFTNTQTDLLKKYYTAGCGPEWLLATSIHPSSE
jgi:hypothetical protein